MTGALDAIAPPAGLEALLEGVPGARLEVIEGADHFFESGLSAVARRVTDWLG